MRAWRSALQLGGGGSLNCLSSILCHPRRVLRPFRKHTPKLISRIRSARPERSRRGLALSSTRFCAAHGVPRHQPSYGETTYKVTVPSGATVCINGITLTGGAADPVTPEFAAGGEAVTTKFEKGEGSTWKITAWGEIGNDASGTGVADGQIKVYRGDEADDVATPVAPTITKKKSAVKVEMTVDAPSGKDSQFFRVDFGE